MPSTRSWNCTAAGTEATGLPTDSKTDLNQDDKNARQTWQRFPLAAAKNTGCNPPPKQPSRMMCPCTAAVGCLQLLRLLRYRASCWKLSNNSATQQLSNNIGRARPKAEARALVTRSHHDAWQRAHPPHSWRPSHGIRPQPYTCVYWTVPQSRQKELCPLHDGIHNLLLFDRLPSSKLAGATCKFSKAWKSYLSATTAIVFVFHLGYMGFAR